MIRLNLLAAYEYETEGMLWGIFRASYIDIYGTELIYEDRESEFREYSKKLEVDFDKFCPPVPCWKYTDNPKYENSKKVYTYYVASGRLNEKFVFLSYDSAYEFTRKYQDYMKEKADYFSESFKEINFMLDEVGKPFMVDERDFEFGFWRVYGPPGSECSKDEDCGIF